MKATLLKPANIGDRSHNSGSTVDVSESTFRNLAKKGILKAADKDAEGVDLKAPSRQTAAEAAARVKARENERKTAKKAHEAAKRELHEE